MRHFIFPPTSSLFKKIIYSIIGENKGEQVQYFFVFLIIIFLFIVFMLIMRYEKKLELLNQSIQNIKEEVNELKNTTQNNRSLIEKNRSDIESINK